MLARGESQRCPCCRRELVIPAIEHYFTKSTVLLRLFNLLTEHPYGLTHAELMWEIYRGKEPNCISALSARISQFNKAARARGLGLRIYSKGGSLRRYRIFVVRT